MPACPSTTANWVRWCTASPTSSRWVAAAGPRRRKRSLRCVPTSPSHEKPRVSRRYSYAVATKPKKKASYDLKAADRKRNLAIQIGLTSIVVIFAVVLVGYIVLSNDKRPASGEA